MPGKPTSLRQRERRRRFRRQRIGRGHRGHACARRDLPRGHLVAEQAQRLRPRADEGDLRVGAGFGKLRRFGEEAVARMDGVAPRVRGNLDDVVHGEVGGDGPAILADAIGPVGLEAVEREVVFLRVDRDRGLAHLVGGAQDANGDLAPVRHQYSFEAAHRSARSPDRRVRAFYTDVLVCGRRWRRCSPLAAPISRSTASVACDEAGHGIGAEGADAADPETLHLRELAGVDHEATRSASRS